MATGRDEGCQGHGPCHTPHRGPPPPLRRHDRGPTRPRTSDPHRVALVATSALDLCSRVQQHDARKDVCLFCHVPSHSIACRLPQIYRQQCLNGEKWMAWLHYSKMRWRSWSFNVRRYVRGEGRGGEAMGWSSQERRCNSDSAIATHRRCFGHEPETDFNWAGWAE
jgi:hypothetical protein